MVFGDGIWKTTHGDHAKTQAIIANLISNKTLAFGYVDLGVKTQNLTEAQMREAVDGWAAMGAIVRFSLHRRDSRSFNSV